MFKAIVRFSIRKKLFVGLTTLFLFIGGIYAMLTLPIDAVPDITNNQVQIVTVSPTLAPQEVEQLITMPIEIAMSNIMNVEDIRSVSRFGLSVVTVVFKEDVPTLDARQLINEQIQTVSGEISPELGTPEMMPITTGLGEIYQYILKVAPGYEEKYDAMELRTIQDWMVKRQLSGIPGIVEINSFGGYLKQYEVAVDPDALFSLNITIGEVFEALSSNNQNTGGSYIEKAKNAYYIRSEGMITRIKDIEQIVVANRNGIPVHISDVGTVRFGAPKRFGAMTMDGKGECVGGIAMMLKGANANVVTQELEKRVEKIQHLLPEGISIEPYLNRSELVNRNISTVVNNLIEGAIIVFLVLIIFLGNVRAGLIVASVIPLAMLFAFIMMRLFNVTANLMSLGAIDFGIVVDGSIVILEGILAHIYSKQFRGRTLTRKEMDEEVEKGASGVVRSATFAVLIILIVFIPILTGVLHHRRLDPVADIRPYDGVALPETYHRSEADTCRPILRAAEQTLPALPACLPASQSTHRSHCFCRTDRLPLSLHPSGCRVHPDTGRRRLRHADDLTRRKFAFGKYQTLRRSGKDIDGSVSRNQARSGEDRYGRSPHRPDGSGRRRRDDHHETFQGMDQRNEPSGNGREDERSARTPLGTCRV